MKIILPPILHYASGYTPLMRAALSNRRESLHVLLSLSRESLNARDLHGATAAWHACARDAADALEELLRWGCDLSLSDTRFGQTPIDLAVEHVTDHGTARCLSVLRRAGVNDPRLRGMHAVVNEDEDDWEGGALVGRIPA